MQLFYSDLQFVLVVIIIYFFWNRIKRRIKRIITRVIRRAVTKTAKTLKIWLLRRLKIFWINLKYIIYKDVISAFYYLRYSIVLRIPPYWRWLILRTLVIISYSYLGYYFWIFSAKFFFLTIFIITGRVALILGYYLLQRCPNPQLLKYILTPFLVLHLTNNLSYQYFTNWVWYLSRAAIF